MTLQYVKKHFSTEQVQIIIVMVNENLGISSTRNEEAEALALVEKKLSLIANALKGFNVVTRGFVGKPGACICKMAREYNADYIVMTKSAQPDMLSMIGRTAEYVLNNAPCNVLIISENRMNAGEYKGLIYKKASATVNLRGQIGDKQSECLLPSVDADCNYHFDVTVGKIRFFHTAYDPETSNWDMPPSSDQLASVDIAAGETADILVKANSVDGKADRIRIINRGMKQEAVFSYTITAAKKTIPQPMDIPEAPGSMPAPAVISLDDFPVPSVYGADFEPIEESAPEPVAVKDQTPVEMLEEEPVPVFEIKAAHARAEAPTVEPATMEMPVEEPAPVEDPKAKHTPASMDETLAGLEDFMPDEIEIADVMNELSGAFNALDNKAEPAVSPMDALRKYQEPAVQSAVQSVAQPVAKPVVEQTEDLVYDDDPIEPTPEPVSYEPNMEAGKNSTGRFSFEGIFGSMPELTPIESVASNTLRTNLGDIHKDFTTGQLDYVEDSSVTLDDFI